MIKHVVSRKIWSVSVRRVVHLLVQDRDLGGILKE